MSETRRRRGSSGFEIGAQALEMSVKNLVELYKTTIHVIEVELQVGKVAIPTGLLGTLQYVDLLHGGAYAVPLNERPFYMDNPQNSKYWVGEGINTKYSTSLLSFLGQLGAGSNAIDLANEILLDANVPHVFPKLISDEAYAMTRMLFAQAATTNLFTQTSTGIKTLVEAGTQAFSAGTSERRERRLSRRDEDERDDRESLGFLGTILGDLED